MSRTTIKAIWPGERHESVGELSNSWGSAPVVWNALAERYLGKPNYAYLSGNMSPLWELWKRTDVPESYRAVHMLTFDRAYVLRRDFARMAKDIRVFLSDFESSPGANHWPAVVEFLEKNPDYPAIGLYCTSVACDPFEGPWNEELDRNDPLDWETAYDLYEELDSLKERPAPLKTDGVAPEPMRDATQHPGQSSGPTKGEGL